MSPKIFALVFSYLLCGFATLREASFEILWSAAPIRQLFPAKSQSRKEEIKYQ